MARHVVARAAEVPEGASRVVSVRGREIAVFNVGGEFFALINRCPHEGAPLAAGLVASAAGSALLAAGCLLVARVTGLDAGGTSVLAALLTAAAAGAPAQAPRPVDYTCADGTRVTATFSPPGNAMGSVKLAYAGSSSEVTLPQAVSADGGRYVRGDVEFWIRDGRPP